MPNLTCPSCGTTFYRTPRHAERTAWSVCSVACRAAEQHRIALERALTNYDVTELGCWEHRNKPTDRWGYRMFRVGGKSRPAHRAFYEHHVGPIPDGLQIDHLCRNPACVNPDHLEPVTPKENMARSSVPRVDNRCRRGHEMTAENTRWVHASDGRTWSQCRACARESNKLRMRRKRATLRASTSPQIVRLTGDHSESYAE